MTMPAFEFSTKAGTLDALADRLTTAKLPAQVTVSFVDWRADMSSVLTDIISRFADQRLAVRSSAANEDTHTASLAGVHLSLINIDCDEAVLHQAIDDVFGSYGDPQPLDEVLVQPMIEDTVVAGVVLTRDLDTGAPYYVINYDDFSGRTDTVTSGAESKVVLVHRGRPEALRSPRFRDLVKVVQEIEEIAESDALDIEFCIDGDDNIFLLQVRPLAARSQWPAILDDKVNTALEGIREQIAALRPEVGTVGTSRPVFGEMPDWNPAEMIGSAPRPLALSLYQELITDEIWFQARAEMGYRSVPYPLMHVFAGRPYIDTRLSFNSFLPSDLDEDLAGRLVDYQLGRLSAQRNLHDKIEFEIAITAKDLSGPDQFEHLAQAGFTNGEILRLNRALTKLTQRLLDDDLSAQIALTEQLAEESRNWNPKHGLFDKSHIVDLRNRGTLPFAKLARHGFVAVLMLRSLVKTGVFSQGEAEGYMRGIPTIASELLSDLRNASEGTLPPEAVKERYGHLRPGAYDIRSDRYDKRPDLFLDGIDISNAAEKPDVRFIPSASHKSKIDDLLAGAGLEYDASRLLDYITKSIQARELAKFNFMKGVSRVLEMTAAWGAAHKFDREDLSFLSLHQILGGSQKQELWEAIERGRNSNEVTRAIRLPHVIAEISDIDIVRMPLGQPNFITSLSVAAAPKLLAGEVAADIAGKIVLIESADPGFDWIFTRGIAGLVTKYGGANSHMAIRAAEFGLPAAIGCGTRLFDVLSVASAIELDCAARIVRPIG